MRKGWAVAAALGIYCFFGLMLIAQKPGLQYDEAFLVAGAVHMRHPEASFNLAVEPHTWVCPFQRCVPLMGAGSSYVGAIKDYLALALFALFGPRTILIRLISMLLGMLGIWGLAKLVAERIGEREAAATSLILALSPAYTAMTVFDNNGVAAMMAGLGLTAAALAAYLRRRGATAAFVL